MAIRDIIQRTAKALTGSPSADELRAVLREARERLAQADARLEQIGEQGAERARVLREGSTAALVALDDELKTLNAEAKQLRHRAKELHAQEKRQRAVEAVRGAKELKRKITETVQTAEDAQATYARAQDATARQVADLRRVVKLCNDENINPAPLLLDATTIERANALLEPQGRKTRADTQRELMRDIGEPTKGKGQQRPGTEKKGSLVPEG